MVQFRIINGGKSKSDSYCTKVRLFRAYSTLDNYQGRDAVRFNWVYRDRVHPVAPFERLIDSYKSIDDRVRPFYEDYIKELFTEDEVQALESYLLESRGSSLHIIEESIPASEIFVPMPFATLPHGPGRGFYDLSDDEAYDLPFKAGAYFDLRSCPLSIAMQQDVKEEAVSYLQEALRRLGLVEHTALTHLSTVVEQIYNDCGLYVTKGKTREERLNDKGRQALDDKGAPTD